MVELISVLGSNLGSALTIAVSFLVALTIVVFVHEYGHFQVARWCGVGIKTFSIGFGKELFGWKDRHGTHWRVAAIPLGGYVQFIDDANPASAGEAAGKTDGKKVELTEEQRRVSFHTQPVWKRAAVVAAGPLYNFIFAILIFAITFMLLGKTVMEARVAEVQPDTPAATAGFKPGDLITSINGTQIEGFSDLQQIVSSRVGQELEFGVDRGGAAITLKATPELRKLDDIIAGKIERPVIGIRASREVSKLTHKRVGPFTAVGLGAQQTWGIITGTMGYLSDVIMGRQSSEQIGGIIRIADTAGKIAVIDWRQLIMFTAFISVSIGLINLFPIPILDGGHLVFYAIEFLRGKPLSERVQEYSFRVGLALILMLMAFGFYNDRGILARWLTWSS